MPGETANVIRQVTYGEEAGDPREHQSMIGAMVGVWRHGLLVSIRKPVKTARFTAWLLQLYASLINLCCLVGGLAGSRGNGSELALTVLHSLGPFAVWFMLSCRNKRATMESPSVILWSNLVQFFKVLVSIYTHTTSWTHCQLFALVFCIWDRRSLSTQSKLVLKSRQTLSDTTLHL